MQKAKNYIFIKNYEREKLKKLDKAMCQKEHFKNRMKERFGISVNRIDIKEISNLVNEKNKVLDVTKREKHYKIKFKEKEIIIVYDEKRKVPVTAYPVNWFEETKKRVEKRRSELVKNALYRV